MEGARGECRGVEDVTLLQLQSLQSSSISHSSSGISDADYASENELPFPPSHVPAPLVGGLVGGQRKENQHPRQSSCRQTSGMSCLV